jgi:hypothetical protein
VFLAQPLQLNRQGRALFFAHFVVRHAPFGPNHARLSGRPRSDYASGAGTAQAVAWTVTAVGAALVTKRSQWSRNLAPN